MTPTNSEAETALISSAIVDPDIIEQVIDIVKEEDFSDRRNAAVWKALVILRTSGRAVDLLTLENEVVKMGLRIENDYLETISQRITTSAHAVDYAKIIHELGTRRKLIRSGTMIQQAAGNLSTEITDVLSQSQGFFLEAIGETSSSIATDIPSIAVRQWPIIKSEYEGKLSGIPTGFPNTLDRFIRGWQKQQFYILAGRPGWGKTTLERQLSYNLAKAGIGNVNFSLEVSEREHLKSLPFLIAKVPENKNPIAGYTETDFRRIEGAKGIIDQLHCLYIVDSTPQSSETIAAKIMRLKKERDISVVFIDYLQLMEGAERRGDFENVDPIARNLKLLARQLDVAVVALSKMNRKIDSRGIDAEPQLSDLYLGGESDADVVFFIQPKEPRQSDVLTALHQGYVPATLWIKKNRFGPMGSSELRFFKAQKRFEEIQNVTQP